MSDPNLTESAWRRARSESVRIYPSTEFEVAAALMTIIAGAVAAVASAGETITAQIAVPIVGGAVALLFAFGVVFAVQLVAAPIRQRDELRRAWSRPEPQPVQPVNVELTLRNERRKGGDLLNSFVGALGHTTADELAVEEWTEGLVDLLSEHLDADAAKRFIEATKHVSRFSDQLDARLRALDEIIRGLE